MSYDGMSFNQAENIKENIKPQLWSSSLSMSQSRKNVMRNLADVAARETFTSPADWNTLICQQGQCSWNFPTCSNQYLIIKYGPYYFEASQCGCNAMGGVGGGGGGAGPGAPPAPPPHGSSKNVSPDDSGTSSGKNSSP